VGICGSNYYLLVYLQIYWKGTDNIQFDNGTVVRFRKNIIDQCDSSKIVEMCGDIQALWFLWSELFQQREKRWTMTYIQKLQIYKGIQQLIPARRETGKVLFVLKSCSQIVKRKKIFVNVLLENRLRKTWEANLGTIVCKNGMSWKWTRRVI